MTFEVAGRFEYSTQVLSFSKMTNQRKSNQVPVFEERRKPEYPEKKPLGSE